MYSDVRHTFIILPNANFFEGHFIWTKLGQSETSFCPKLNFDEIFYDMNRKKITISGDRGHHPTCT